MRVLLKRISEFLINLKYLFVSENKLFGVGISSAVEIYFPLPFSTHAGKEGKEGKKWQWGQLHVFYFCSDPIQLLLDSKIHLLQCN